MINKQAIVLTLFMVFNISSSLSVLKISTQFGDDANEMLTANFGKTNSIEELLKSTFKTLTADLDNTGLEKNNNGDHPCPSKKEQRAIWTSALANTGRQLRSAFDVRKFITGDKNDSPNDLLCETTDGETCPYLDLMKKKNLRYIDNVNDDIEYYNNVNKDGKCPYLNLKVTILGRINDNLKLVNDWIDANNKPDSNGDGRKELAVACLDNDILSIQDTKSFIVRMLAQLRDEEVKKVQGACPYLDLKVRLQARKVASAVNRLALLQYLNRKKKNTEQVFDEKISSIIAEVKKENREDDLVFQTRRNDFGFLPLFREFGEME